MKNTAITIFILGALMLGPGTLTAGETQPGNYYGARLSDKPDWFKESFLEFEADVADAAEEGKRVMLYFYQDGCPYCARLVEENFADPEIRTFIQQHFDGITINMWGDREVVSVAGQDFTEKTFSAALKVQYTPTLLFLDERGKVALRLNGYYPPEDLRAALDYVANKLETRLSFSKYRMQALSDARGQLIDEDFYLKTTDLQSVIAGSDKPLAVYFESANCDECRTTHERVLTDKATRKLVVMANNVQFNVVSDEKIVTPAGEPTTASQWAEDLGIAYTPSVVFFDRAGKEVMRISGFMKTFHFQSVYAYVLERAYLDEPSFQRYIAARGEHLREAGHDIDIWGYESFHE